MSYCTGKNIEKSRGKAIKMLVVEKTSRNSRLSLWDKQDYCMEMASKMD